MTEFWEIGESIGFHVCFWLGLNMLESLPNTVNRQGNSKRMLKITYARQHDLGRVSCDVIRMWLWCYMHMYSIDSILCMLQCCRARRPSSHWHSRPPIGSFMWSSVIWQPEQYQPQGRATCSKGMALKSGWSSKNCMTVIVVVKLKEFPETVGWINERHYSDVLDIASGI